MLTTENRRTFIEPIRLEEARRSVDELEQELRRAEEVERKSKPAPTRQTMADRKVRFDYD